MIEEPENTEAAEESDTVVSDEATTASAPAATPEPVAELSPKERRSQKRAASRGTEARPAQTQEERTTARLEKRKANADERRRYRGKSREKRRSTGEGTPKAERSGTGSPRVLRGTVVSDKADKTISVRIDVARQHRTYGKIVRTSSKLSAHDEQNEAHAGDTVRVVESRPLSRSKRWRLVEVVEKAR